MAYLEMWSLLAFDNDMQCGHSNILKKYN